MVLTVARRFDEAQRDARVIVLDGGLATELERRGLDLSDRLWSACALLEDPLSILEVHRDYLRAGAQCISTASYQATLPGLRASGLTEASSRAVLLESVRLAQRAREEFHAIHAKSDPPLVAASIGPYGAFLADGSEYRGDYGRSVQQLFEFHMPRLELLATSGADLFACETIPCLVEAEAICRCLESIHEMPAWVSFSCRSESEICHGESIADAVAMVQDISNVVAVGVNCTDLVHIEGLIERMRETTIKPIVVYPNSGECWDGITRTWSGGTGMADFVDAARRWRQRGATLIGGCCRTGPEHIRALSRALARG